MSTLPPKAPSPAGGPAAALASLNPEQERAVSFAGGPCLVVAGAGSGKTRVLTHRVAYLIGELGVDAGRILAFTFTNRAAREMRERLAALVGEVMGRLWVGTFHATCLRILRREAGRLGYPAGFVVFDREDQAALVKQVMRERELEGRLEKPGFFLARISGAKNALVDPAEYEASAVTPQERQAARVYAAYQQALAAQAAMDFDDLIAHAVRLLETDPEVRARYAGRFEHVLVDEYQDTNHAQFRLVSALASAHGNVLAVGDEDQSIYGWRGADLANVLDFEQRFPGAAILRLEQNYRSSGTIVAAATAVVANNRLRRGKRLWTDRPEGAPIRLVLSGDDQAEASRLAGEVLRQVGSGRSYRDCAVLFRTNAQSRALEVAFRQRGVPYELVGGVSFYERREVKDLLSYLRLAVNPQDRVSFLRILNVPRRGLGAQAQARLEARLGEAAPAEALRAALAAGELPHPGRAGGESLLALLEGLAADRAARADLLLERVLAETGYAEYLDEVFPEDATERRENIEELVHAARAHGDEHPDAPAEDFLSEAALVTDVDRWSDADERAVLMTAHNAKGLEFPVVMIAGCEEGIFPHATALQDEAELEEERRLFHVALTRAREEVIVSAAAFRRRYDGGGGGELSRFAREIPSELLVVENPPGWPAAGGRSQGPRAAATDRVRSRRARAQAQESPDGWAPPAAARHEAVGRTVYHDSFGKGRVEAVEGAGPDARFLVRFAGVGVKKVLGRFLTPDE